MLSGFDDIAKFVQWNAFAKFYGAQKKSLNTAKQTSSGL
jgi:hypothetical protein